MRRLALAAALSFLAAGCRLTEPLPDEGAPRRLAYAWSGYAVRSTAVRLAGDTVVVVTRDFERPADSTVTRRVPAAAEWRTFWRTVDRAGVRRWPAACRDPEVADGGGFRYELAWSAGSRSGAYENAFPTRGGACRDGDLTADARAFVTAVLAVAAVDPATAW